MGLKEIMATALSELTEHYIRRQRKEDVEMDKLVEHRIELSNRMKKAMEEMDEPERALFDEYFDITESIHGREAENLYMQGVKDGVRILKELEGI